jgi:hypothetical protein
MLYFLVRSFLVQTLKPRLEVIMTSRSPTLRAMRATLEIEPNPGLEQVVNWLGKFERKLGSVAEPAEVAAHLVQLSVEHSAHCLCAQDLDLPAVAWMHANHPTYNKVVRELLEAYRSVDTVREVLIEDMAVKDKYFGEDSEPFGEIVSKAYGHVLIQNFLAPTPNPDWVGA